MKICKDTKKKKMKKRKKTQQQTNKQKTIRRKNSNKNLFNYFQLSQLTAGKTDQKENALLI